MIFKEKPRSPRNRIIILKSIIESLEMFLVTKINHLQLDQEVQNSPFLNQL